MPHRLVLHRRGEPLREGLDLREHALGPRRREDRDVARLARSRHDAPGAVAQRDREDRQVVGVALEESDHHVRVADVRVLERARIGRVPDEDDEPMTLERPARRALVDVDEHDVVPRRAQPERDRRPSAPSPCDDDPHRGSPFSTSSSARSSSPIRLETTASATSPRCRASTSAAF